MQEMRQLFLDSLYPALRCLALPCVASLCLPSYLHACLLTVRHSGAVGDENVSTELPNNARAIEPNRANPHRRHHWTGSWCSIGIRRDDVRQGVSRTLSVFSLALDGCGRGG